MSQPTVHRALTALTARGQPRREGRARVMADGRTAVPAGPAPPVFIGPAISAWVRDQPGRHHGRRDAIALAVQQRLGEAGVPLLILPPQTEAAMLDSVHAGSLILQAADLAIATVAGALAWAAARRVPVVAYGDPAQLAGCHRVLADHAGATAALVRLLAARDRRRILPLWFGDERGRASGWWFAEREQGYRAGCVETGCAPLEPLCPPLLSQGLTPRQSLAVNARIIAGSLAPLLVQGVQFDAILAPTDGLLPAIAEALRSLGRDPERDVALAGYDDYLEVVRELEFAPCRPVASVDKDHPAIGAALAELSLALPRRADGAGLETRVVAARIVEYELH